MTKINMELKGMDKLVKKLKTFGEQAEKETAMETKAAAQNIVADAKLLAPVGTPESTGIKGYIGGTLKGSIYIAQPITAKDGLTWAAVANAHYAPYVEFGTGRYSAQSIPSELRVLAGQFKGKGIRNTNTPPRPFMYPAFLMNRDKYIKRLKQMLKRYAKDVTR
ncbi:MAG: hypothetical protein GY739_10410 [Mesoflavibacter sp.]|nr:hypothetical protein [Mesoflavibacter sp.]